jgi:hypothetical protein
MEAVKFRFISHTHEDEVIKMIRIPESSHQLQNKNINKVTFGHYNLKTNSFENQIPHPPFIPNIISKNIENITHDQ